MPLKPTPNFDPLNAERSLEERVAELEARLAFLTIRLNILSERRSNECRSNDAPKILANDAIAGIALFVICFGGIFLVWGLT